ncbi:hypothetical protein T06_1457 [Trichinella sp. T6]|nr:hypothetical protein T06_1457 [Trichinella sp. T6]
MTHLDRRHVRLEQLTNEVLCLRCETRLRPLAASGWIDAVELQNGPLHEVGDRRLTVQRSQHASHNGRVRIGVAT